jgi:hypothetical protein
MCGNDGNRRTIGQTFGQTNDEVAFVDELQIEKRLWTDVEHRVRRDHARQKRHGSDPNDQHHGHHEARDKTRFDQVVDWISSTHAKRVDLFGDDHRSDLGSNACANACSEHERSDRSRKIADHQLHVRCANQAEFGDDSRKLEASLEHQDHPDETHHDGQKDERSVADLEHLVDDGFDVGSPSKAVVERLDKQRPQLQTRVDQVQCFATKGFDKRGISFGDVVVLRVRCGGLLGIVCRTHRGSLEGERDEVVDDEDARSARDDRRVDRFANARCATFDAEPVVAAR